jgi:hypothetical protein
VRLGSVAQQFGGDETNLLADLGRVDQFRGAIEELRQMGTTEVAAPQLLEADDEGAAHRVGVRPVELVEHEAAGRGVSCSVEGQQDVAAHRIGNVSDQVGTRGDRWRAAAGVPDHSQERLMPAQPDDSLGQAQFAAETCGEHRPVARPKSRVPPTSEQRSQVVPVKAGHRASRVGALDQLQEFVLAHGLVPLRPAGL